MSSCLEEYIDPIDSSIKYPKIRINGIEVCCLHCRDCEEAVKDWEKEEKG